jgi:hypothetical protein
MASYWTLTTRPWVAKEREQEKEQGQKASGIASQRLANLFVADVRRMNTAGQSVCIVGVVVSMIRPGDLEACSRPVGYLVDDGTGVIKVNHFMQKSLRRGRDVRYTERAEANVLATSRDRGLESLARSTAALEATAREPVEMGTCVEVKGKTDVYQGQVQVLAFSVRVVPNIKYELDRTIAVHALK